MTAEFSSVVADASGAVLLLCISYPLDLDLSKTMALLCFTRQNDVKIRSVIVTLRIALI